MTHDNVEQAATAVLFPGQGSQEPGMRADVEREAPEVLAELADAIGDDPFERLDDGTRFVQPALFCRSIASWYGVCRHHRPSVLAGHSVGEIAALVAGGALSLRDGMRLAVARGRITDACTNGGGMLAVLKLETGVVERIAGRRRLAVANYNAPGQIVLAGPRPALDGAASEIWDAGGLPVKLDVQGAFHSSAQQDAVPRFQAVLDTITFRRSRIPVYAGSNARPFRDPARELAESLVRPVRWVDVLRALRGLGVTHYIEAAPGAVLSGLVRRTLDGAIATPAQEIGLQGIAA